MQLKPSYRPYTTPDHVRIVQLDILALAISTLEPQPLYPSYRRRGKPYTVHPMALVIVAFRGSYLVAENHRVSRGDAVL